jgi:hypothetical protein
MIHADMARAIPNETTSSYTFEIGRVVYRAHDSTAVGADLGLARCRREFQHASQPRAPFAPGS